MKGAYRGQGHGVVQNDVRGATIEVPDFMCRYGGKSRALSSFGIDLAKNILAAQG